MHRRTLVAALSALYASRAVAQAYPTRPVRFLVPFIPGSAPDVIARQIAERLSPALGQPVVVENRPGSGGNIGFTHGARAANDGYTLILGTNSLVINPALYARASSSAGAPPPHPRRGATGPPDPPQLQAGRAPGGGEYGKSPRAITASRPPATARISA
jgi:hypothetical protein